MRLILNVISPHRDDAALSLTGTLSKFSTASIHINIISCFTVTNWAPFLPDTLTTEEITAARQSEDEHYVKLLGESVSLIDLAMMDSPLRPDTIPASQYGYDIFTLAVIGAPDLKKLEAIKRKPILIRNQNDDSWIYGLGKGGVATLTKLDNPIYKNLLLTTCVSRLDASTIPYEVYEDIILREGHIPRSEKPDDRIIDNSVKNQISLLEKKLSQFACNHVVWAIPLALGHRDHFIARTAALAVAKGSPYFFYEEIPYGLYLPEEEIMLHLKSLEKTINNRLSYHQLSEDTHLAHWYKAVRCYSSQFLDEQVLSMAAMLKSRHGERIWGTPEFDRWKTSVFASHYA